MPKLSDEDFVKWWLLGCGTVCLAIGFGLAAVLFAWAYMIAT